MELSTNCVVDERCSWNFGAPADTPAVPESISLVARDASAAVESGPGDADASGQTEGSIDRWHEDGESTVVGRLDKQPMRQKLLGRLRTGGVIACAGLALAASGCGRPVTQNTFSGKSVVRGAAETAGLAIRAPFDIGHFVCMSFMITVGSEFAGSNDLYALQYAQDVCGDYVKFSGPPSDPNVDTTSLSHTLSTKAERAGFTYYNLTGAWFDTSGSGKQCVLNLTEGPYINGKPTYAVLTVGNGWHNPVIIGQPNASAAGVRRILGC